MGRPTREVFRCAVCGVEECAPQSIEAVCGSCGKDLHTCTNCRYFDTSARWECRAEIEARVSKKSTRNECAQLQPKLTLEHETESTEPGEGKAAFDALFKGL